MQRFLDWIKRKGDQNIVQYSRFGLPGEETDDRPPPTTIHVACFNDNDKKFLIFGTHSQKAAVVSAGVGISAVIFLFLSIFFEFDWYHHEKGVDFVGLIMFLTLGVMIHWYVIRGIKIMQPKFLVPFIIVYGAVLFFEFVFFIFTLNHWLAINYLNKFSAKEPGAFILLLCTFGIVMLCQGGMMFSVVRCRNYLEMKSIHALEMRVVEKSKQQFPGIRVIYGEGNGQANDAVTDRSVGESFQNASVVENGRVPPLPSYEDSIASPPQRTVLQGHEQ